MMRIGGGELRGRKLVAPKGLETRPTSARLKKSLFDVVGSELEGARVLDLYAGAGALGIEALSRGAVSAVFVDRVRRAGDAIARNVRELGIEDRADVWVMDALRALSKLSSSAATFEVVFADPPYASSDLSDVLTACGSAIVEPDGLVVVEHHHKRQLDESYGSLSRVRTLKSGESCFTLYRRVC